MNGFRFFVLSILQILAGMAIVLWVVGYNDFTKLSWWRIFVCAVPSTAISAVVVLGVDEWIFRRRLRDTERRFAMFIDVCTHENMGPGGPHEAALRRISEMRAFLALPWHRRLGGPPVV